MIPTNIEKPVAWRVKDFADGWVLFETEAHARQVAELAGALMEPVYAAALISSLREEVEKRTQAAQTAEAQSNKNFQAWRRAEGMLEEMEAEAVLNGSVLKQIISALTFGPEPEDYNPTALGRAQDVAKAYLHNFALAGRATSAEASLAALAGRVGELLEWLERTRDERNFPSHLFGWCEEAEQRLTALLRPTEPGPGGSHEGSPETHDQAMACLSCGLAGLVPPSMFPLVDGLWDHCCPKCGAASVWVAPVQEKTVEPSQGDAK